MSLSPPFAAKYSDDPFNDWPQWRKDMGLGPHRGKDWSVPAGTRIPASGDGFCTWEGWNNVLGWCVVIRYKTAFGQIHFGYCHMQSRSDIRVGSQVTEGDLVGISGNTGSASTGAHLHMTASWSNGDPGTVAVVDPMQFFTGSTPAGSGTTPIPQEEYLMSFSFVPDAKSNVIYACSLDNGRRVAIANEYHMALLQRFRANGGADKMLLAEMDIARGYLASFEEGNDSEKIIAAIKAQAVTPAAMRDALKAAISEGVGIKVDAKVGDKEMDAIAERVARLLGIRLAGGKLAGS